MIRLIHRGLFALLLLLVAVPSQAGTVYVALASNFSARGVDMETVLQVANTAAEPQSFTVIFVPNFTQGVERAPSQLLLEETVPPFQTRIFRGLTTGAAVGMLEVTGDDGLTFGAFVASKVGEEELIGGAVPVVGSHNQVNGGEPMNSQGWEKTANTVTAYTLLNLSSEPNVCSVELTRANGQALADTAVLTVAPLSVNHWRDAFFAVGQERGKDVRARTICQRPAYSFAHIQNFTTGDLALIPISGDATSDLRPPGVKEECPSSAYCFERAGVYHIPTQGKEKFAVRIPTPPEPVYDILRIQFTVEHNGWYQLNPGGLHNLFWFYRNGVWKANTFGYMNALGPGRSIVRNLTNVNQPAGANLRIDQNGTLLVPGEIYDVDYTYDTRSGRISARLFDSAGNLVVDINSPTSANRVHIEGGFTFESGLKRIHNENPTYGWIYRDLRIIFEN